jgi:hypothetical protein
LEAGSRRQAPAKRYDSGVGYWLAKIICGLFVAALAWVATWLWFEDLSSAIRWAIAGGIGLLFVLLGQNLWHWLGEIAESCFYWGRW